MKKVKFWNLDFEEFNKKEISNSLADYKIKNFLEPKRLTLLKSTKSELNNNFLKISNKIEELNSNLDHLTNYIEYINNIYFSSKEQDLDVKKK